jgi:hypothetical protein
MKSFVAFLLAFGLLAAPILAQDEFVPDKGQTPAKDEPKDPDQEKIKKYEETLKDAVKIEGPFTLYTKKKDNKTDVYWELSPSDLGKYWFLEATLRTGGNGGGLQAGEPINQADGGIDAFRFERKGDNVWLMVPNLAWRWTQNDPLAVAAKRSFPEAILEDYKIEAEHPKTGKFLIKISDLFLGGIFDLSQRVNMSMGRPYNLDRNKSGVSEIKGFPENIVVRSDLYFSSSGGPQTGGMSALMELLGLGGKSHLADARSLPLGVTYLIYPQKSPKAEGSEKPYMPRIADPRVGYFTQDYFDHAKFMSTDRTMRLINRWDLQKKNPGANPSEPIKPIVWYIDDSVPEKWRQACAEGILRWNKAFEKLGFKDAVVVKMKPKDADWDHADMRYNVLRFIDSENAGYAVAWFRTDPFTGEIVNAGISCDANMVSYVGQEYDLVTNPARGGWDAAIARFTRSAPTQEPNANLASIWPNLFRCDLGKGKLESASFGWAALESVVPAGTSLNKDQYINEFLADVISHEAGHCMGLRHNFIASTYLSDKQLADMSVTAEEGASASVMDYVPVNMAAVARGKGHFYGRSIGAYDLFAIEYGYKDVPGSTPQEQRPNLLNIARKGSLPGHLYMSDEQADSFDPYVVRFDNSSNPIDDAALTISVAKKILNQADKKYPKVGRPYSDLSRVVNMAIGQTFRQCMTAARFVGGLAGRRNFAGDPYEKPTLAPVSPAMQRAALQLIARELMAENSFKLSEKMLLNLSGDYNGMYSDAPIRDAISGLQMASLSMLLSADTTDRIANNAFKLQERSDALGLNELYSTLLGKVFSEVGTGKAVGTLRRDLQRFAVEGLIVQATSRFGQVQEDVRMLAWDNLRRLDKRLSTASASDDMTAMHLRDLQRRIQRALKSVVTSGR